MSRSNADEIPCGEITLPTQETSHSQPRRARCLIWLDPDDCDPPHTLDMDSAHDYLKVQELTMAFQDKGFNIDYPALVGYPLNGRVQLLSGTHRHMAAKRAGIKIPVSLWLRSDISESWGTPLWDKTIADISVRELQSCEIEDGPKRSPYDPVDLSLLDK